MKRIISLLLSLALVCSMIPAVLAADESLDNFQKKVTYPTGHFTDVPETQWYASSVQEAYEYGLVNGTGETTYEPNGNITIASTVALACRLHDIYYGGTGSFQQGSPWYQVYVDYAISQGIINEKQFANYNVPATRAQFAVILAKALPGEALPAINQITAGSLPDVPATATFASSVYTLYNAGILTGTDSYGSFCPDNLIMRSEVATIVLRLAAPDRRVQFTPVSAGTPSETTELYPDVYAYLVDLAQGSGTLNDDYYTYHYHDTSSGSSEISFLLCYYPGQDKVVLNEIVDTNGTQFLIGVELPQGLKTPYMAATLGYVSDTELFATADVDPASFSLDSTLSLSYYEGPSSVRSDVASLLSSGVALSLVTVDLQLLAPAGYSLQDFGFTQLP